MEVSQRACLNETESCMPKPPPKPSWAVYSRLDMCLAQTCLESEAMHLTVRFKFIALRIAWYICLEIMENIDRLITMFIFNTFYPLMWDINLNELIKPKVLSLNNSYQGLLFDVKNNNNI